MGRSVAVGPGAGVRVAAAISAGVGVSVGIAVSVGVGVSVGVALGVNATVGVGAGTAVGSDVGVEEVQATTATSSNARDERGPARDCIERSIPPLSHVDAVGEGVPA